MQNRTLEALLHVREYLGAVQPARHAKVLLQHLLVHALQQLAVNLRGRCGHMMRLLACSRAKSGWYCSRPSCFRTSHTSRTLSFPMGLVYFSAAGITCERATAMRVPSRVGVESRPIPSSVCHR